MMNNDTPASATGAAGLKPQTLFGPQSSSNTSATFSAGPEPFYVRAFNLAGGDTITVQAVGGTGSGTAFETYAPLGAPIVITAGTPQVRLDWPGRYRLIFSGASVTAILCEGYLAVSSEPTIYAIGGGGGGGGGFTLNAVDTPSINLDFSGTTSGGTLQALAKISVDAGNILGLHGDGLFANIVVETTSLITLSGNGTQFTPYVIGATLAVLPYPSLAAQPDGLISNAGFGTIIYCVDSPFQITDVFGGERSIASEGETCVGFASAAATVGLFKTCIGHSALANATGTFDEDVAVGHLAGNNATRHVSLSQASTFLGPRAGLGATYSVATCVGRSAGTSSTSVSLIAIGDSAASGIVGDNNIVIGNSAAFGSITMNKSILIGDGVAVSITAGNGVIAIGSNAGTSATGGIIGNTNGCMYIGANAGNGSIFGDVIVIASDDTTPTLPTQSHQIILGKASHTQLRTAGSVISGGAISASDSRLKKDVKPMDSVMGTLDKLNMVNFEWDERALERTKLPYREEDMRKQMAGYIAQEVRELMPEAVSKIKGADGEDYFYLHADRMLPYAFMAIKELKARLEALEAKVK